MVLAKYRPDIDGLRAIAVVSVMLFHAKIGFFAGGFVGVDLFFVISGYLITSLLISEIEQEKFSIAKFYERRIRRIIPALLLMMIVSTAIFSFILIPDDLENYGQSVVATIFFSNNILLWMTSGYFESSIDLKPLAHTWSLGVEEQFYLFAPLLLVLGYKLWRHAGIIAFLSISFIGSFAFCIVAARLWPDANFYLIFSRVWEIGAGSVAATQGASAIPARIGRTWSAILSNIGLIVVCVSVYAYGKNLGNPDAYTLGIIAATYAVISFNQEGFFAYRFLSNRLFLFIGAISYSLYVWHQPIYVFIRVASLEEPGLGLFVMGVAATFLCAYLSWRFVEKPFRDRSKVGTRALYLITGSVSALLIAVGLAMHFTSGFYTRWPELAQGDKDFGKGMNIAFNEGPYRYRGQSFAPAGNGQKILVLGNSYARDFINMLDKTDRLQGRQIVYSDIDLCRVRDDNRHLMSAARAADIIVVATKLDAELTPCVLRDRELLMEQGQAKFIVIGTKNFGWNNNAIMMMEPSVRYGYQAKVVDDYMESNALGRQAIPAGEYVDVLALISPRYGYVPVFTPDRKFISQDREHLTPAGAKYIGEMIFRSPLLAAIPQNPRHP